MTSDRQKRIETLFHAALERVPEDRAGFLEAGCGEDGALRGEVETLLKRVGVDDFLEGPPAVRPGTRLGQHEILAPLGKGGMGEVWRARDKKLGRVVALKTLPSEVSQSPERLRNGPLPIESALGIGGQIAEALESAHNRGVIHRDLKPGNIKVTPDGSVRVLDFGLAKAVSKAPSDAVRTGDATESLTHEGAIQGMPAYMSPEQVRGEPTDAQTDIRAFGCVLYEMLAGRRVFEGDTASDLMAGVLRADPDWARLPAGLHPRIRLLLERCLERNRRDRYHDVADVRVDIRKALGEGRAVAVEPAPPAARPVRPATI